MGRSLLVIVLALGAGACDGEFPSVRFGPEDGSVVVSTAAAAYTWEGIAETGLVASLRNESDRTVYSNVGDGFAGFVQERLHIAMGTDAVLQRETAPGIWVSVEVGHLIEGSRTVRLAGGGVFHLSGIVMAQVDGTYRIRLRFYGDPDRSGQPFEAISNTFTIR